MQMKIVGDCDFHHIPKQGFPIPSSLTKQLMVTNKLITLINATHEFVVPFYHQRESKLSVRVRDTVDW